MPTAILKFKLPDEEPEFRSAVDGAQWKLVAWEIDQYLRGQVKYASDETPDAVVDALQAVRDRLHEEMGSHSVSFE
jgi:hypothetical protein